MLIERMQQWEKDFELRGLEKGRLQGRQEGEMHLLLRQLRKRFGELPHAVRLHVEQAEPDKLERWGERLLEVESLEALFDDEETAPAPMS